MPLLPRFELLWDSYPHGEADEVGDEEAGAVLAELHSPLICDHHAKQKRQ